MTPVRAAAALATILTALLLQAALIGPIAVPLPVSLPAVLVAVVALREGASTGIALGFSAGLLADLGSEHPAGSLALCWLGVGVVCGMAHDPARRLPARIAVASLAAGLATAAATVLLVFVGSARISDLALVLPAVPADAVLALLLVPVVGFFLSSPALARPGLVGSRG